MTITIHFSVEHPSFPHKDGENTVDAFIDAPGDPEASGNGLIAIVRSVSDEIRRSVVRDNLMVRGSYETEEAFEKDLARFAAEARITDVRFAGSDVAWRVVGLYTGDGGDWSDNVEASSPGAAEFYAKWTMAANQEADPDDWAAFLTTMSRIDITECEFKPVSNDEIREALEALIEEVSAAGHSGPKLDDAVTKLQAMGYEPRLTGSGPRP